MNLKIKQFSLKDLDRVMEIEKASFPEPYFRSYFEKLYQKYPKKFLVAKVENKILGYIVGKSQNKVGEIISLAVDSDWRKKGIGKNLVDSLINLFQKEGIKEILIHVRISNQGGIDFYRKLGFKIIKAVENYYPNGGSAYLMEKKL